MMVVLCLKKNRHLKIASKELCHESCFSRFSLFRGVLKEYTLVMSQLTQQTVNTGDIYPFFDAELSDILKHLLKWI